MTVRQQHCTHEQKVNKILTTVENLDAVFLQIMHMHGRCIQFTRFLPRDAMLAWY